MMAIEHRITGTDAIARHKSHLEAAATPALRSSDGLQSCSKRGERFLIFSVCTNYHKYFSTRHYDQNKIHSTT